MFANADNFLQYAALGVLTLVLLLVSAGIKWGFGEMQQTIQKNTNAMNDLSQALKHRPCLHDDRVFENKK